MVLELLLRMGARGVELATAGSMDKRLRLKRYKIKRNKRLHAVGVGASIAGKFKNFMLQCMP